MPVAYLLVRQLIADKKRPAGGLLQWCAGMLDEPLIIYTAAKPHLPLPKDVGKPQDMVRLNASAIPTLLTRNPVDLDVWLSLPAAQLGGQIFSNYDVIYKIASNIAAHFDVDKHPLVTALRNTSSEMGSLSDGVDMLVCLMRRVAIVVVALGDNLLSKKPSN